MMTAKLLSQRTTSTSLDFRANYSELQLEAGSLPEDTQRAIQRLMTNLGLVFGCLDFIVTPDGEHIFLEVNPMGQFLWVEEACPELTVLDALCHFLVGRNERFDYQPAAPRVHDRDYERRAGELMEANIRRHVERVEANLMNDSPMVSTIQH